jgi:hypothetical protein
MAVRGFAADRIRLTVRVAHTYARIPRNGDPGTFLRRMRDCRSLKVIVYQLQMHNLQELSTLGIEFPAESATIVDQLDIR